MQFNVIFTRILKKKKINHRIYTFSNINIFNQNYFMQFIEEYAFA